MAPEDSGPAFFKIKTRIACSQISQIESIKHWWRLCLVHILLPAWHWGAVAHACMECEIETWCSDEPGVNHNGMTDSTSLFVCWFIRAVSAIWNLKRALKTKCFFGGLPKWFGEPYGCARMQTGALWAYSLNLLVGGTSLSAAEI